jgi:Fic family protein
MYNWQQKDWPIFQYNNELFDNMAMNFQEIAWKCSGKIETLSIIEKNESILDLLINEAIKTSNIEGEFISKPDLIISIKKKLGYQTEKVVLKDKRSIGIADAIVTSRVSFDKKLTNKMMFDWHNAVMFGNKTVKSGKWRIHSEKMQVISGAIGKEIVHFEAPASLDVPMMMKSFVTWFNDSAPNGKNPIKNAIIRAAITHLYFETIHPFEDGNGRIGRILAEKAISQNMKSPVLLSLSNTIEANKKNYYDSLKKAQKSNQINNWIQYFGNVILEAQSDFFGTISFSIKKSKLYGKIENLINKNQAKIIAKMLKEENFEGGMNAKKYQSITKMSKATATRDLIDLVEKNIFISSGNGRNVSYQINFNL